MPHYLRSNRRKFCTRW